MPYDRHAIFERLYTRYSDGIFYPKRDGDFKGEPLPITCRSAYAGYTLAQHACEGCTELRYLSFSHAAPVWKDLSSLHKLEHFSCEAPPADATTPIPELLAGSSALQDLSLEHVQCGTKICGGALSAEDIGNSIPPEKPMHRPDLLRGLSGLRSLRTLKLTGLHAGKSLQELSQLANLEALKIEGVDLSDLQLDFSSMRGLRQIELINCKLTRPPKGLGNLHDLAFIDLSDNPLAALPEDFTLPAGIVELHVDRCGLKTLPAAWGSLKGISLLSAQGNTYEHLPPELGELKSRLKLELRYRAMYDTKAHARWEELGNQPGEFKDFNFKLMVIQRLMYKERILQPAFDIRVFAAGYAARSIDPDGDEGYGMIPEASAWFEALPIPRALLEDITELTADGGDDVYGNISPHWSGEQDFYGVESGVDAKWLPNLKRVSSPFLSARARGQLERRGIQCES